MFYRVFTWGCTLGLAVALFTNCAPTSKEKAEPVPKAKPETHPAPPPAITFKAYHYDMLEEMQKSYERANDIIIGVYAGNHLQDQSRLAYYFDNFITFDKETLEWGAVTNVMLSAFSSDFTPEIITLEEFKTLSDLDKVGICWDFSEQKRYMYIVEGQQMLVFLERITDEINNTSYLNLIDIYPVTEECNAKAVFDWMARDNT